MELICKQEKAASKESKEAANKNGSRLEQNIKATYKRGTLKIKFWA